MSNNVLRLPVLFLSAFFLLAVTSLPAMAQEVSDSSATQTVKPDFFRFRPSLTLGIGTSSAFYTQLPAITKPGFSISAQADMGFMVGDFMIRPGIMYERNSFDTFAYNGGIWDLKGSQNYSSHKIMVPLSLGYMYWADPAKDLGFGISIMGFYGYICGGDWGADNLSGMNGLNRHSLGWGCSLDLYTEYVFIGIQLYREETPRFSTQPLTDFKTMGAMVKIGFVL